jgi:hypothetical protein
MQSEFHRVRTNWQQLSEANELNSDRKDRTTIHQWLTSAQQETSLQAQIAMTLQDTYTLLRDRLLDIKHLLGQLVILKILPSLYG